MVEVVLCCLCQEPCSPGGDLRSHLREGHGIKAKEELVNKVKKTMDEHIRRKRTERRDEVVVTLDEETDDVSNSSGVGLEVVTLDEDNEENRSNPHKSDENKTSQTKIDSINCDFIKHKQKHIIKNMFKTDSNVKPGKLSTKTATFSDIMASLARMKKGVQEMAVSPAMEEELSAEVKALYAKKELIGNGIAKHLADEKLLKEDNKETIGETSQPKDTSGGKFKVPLCPSPGGRGTATFLCPWAPACSSTWTKVEMRRRRAALDHLEQVHQVDTGDVGNTVGQFKFEKVYI